MARIVRESNERSWCVDAGEIRVGDSAAKACLSDVAACQESVAKGTKQTKGQDLR